MIRHALIGLCLTTSTAIPAHASDAFESLWLGFNVGKSAFPGATDPFERDPTSITTADFDGDGRLDVAVSNVEFAAPGGGTDGMSGFAVIFGEPNRRFSSPTHVTVSNRGCWDVEAADFNDDGSPDIAVSIANNFWEGFQVRVYLNDGAGGFPTSYTHTVADGPIGLASGDFDVDGDRDLAVASYRWDQNEGMITILLGDGTGALSLGSTYLVGMRPWKMEADDLDGDGDLDLAVAHELHEVSILSNAGDGTFVTSSYSGFFPMQGGQYYGCLALADADRDGDRDIFYSNTRSGQPTLYPKYIVHLRNDGGGFVRMPDIPATAATDLVSGDVNGDTWPDLIAVEHSARVGDGPQILLNDGAGGFLAPTRYPGGQGTFAVTLVDIDGDSDEDMLTADRYSMAVTVHENPGDDLYPAPHVSQTAAHNIRADAGDVDGDGDLDVLTSAEGFGSDGALLRNNGDGTFEPPVLYTHSEEYGRGVSRGKLRDLDGDGDLDLLYNGAHTDFHDGYNFYTAPNDGAGNFGPITQWFIYTCGNGDVDAFDIDEDGDLDVINCEELSCGPGDTANRLFISLNNGDGTFAPPYTIRISTGPHALIGDDLNADGHIDLVTTHWMPYGVRDFINVHLGNGDGTFQEELVYDTGVGPRWVVAADFTGDGILDLATANSGGDVEGNMGRETMTVLVGAGDGTFFGRTDYYLPFSSDLLAATGITSGDVDADGDVDIMATTSANGMALYENDGAGSFTFRIRYGIWWDPWDPIYRDFDNDGVADLLAVTADGASTALGSGVVVLAGLEPSTVDVEPSGPASPAGLGSVMSAPTPNPFRSVAQFHVTLPADDHVDILVFDAGGRRVGELFAGELSGGVRHVFALAGEGLPVGAYFVRVRGSSVEATRKVLLVR